MFADFDFTVLDDPAFKEDSVREELIAPMLKALGYSASPPNQILRSVSLKHPYIYIGTKKHPVHIIPDYLIKRGGKNFLIIDAKSPKEEIHKGKNVEQAYSYAIHRDVRADLYALCNGHEFVLFHVSHWPEVLSFPMKDLDNVWETLLRVMGTESEVNKAIIKPDLGLHLLRLGFALDNKLQKITQLFTLLDVDFVALVDDSTYTLNSHLIMDGVEFLATFDFSRDLMPKFLKCLEPKSVVQEVAEKLKKYPFRWQRTERSFGFIGVACNISDHVQSTTNESFCPFVVTDFI